MLAVAHPSLTPEQRQALIADTFIRPTGWAYTAPTTMYPNATTGQAPFVRPAGPLSRRHLSHSGRQATRPDPAHHEMPLPYHSSFRSSSRRCGLRHPVIREHLALPVLRQRSINRHPGPRFRIIGLSLGSSQTAKPTAKRFTGASNSDACQRLAGGELRRLVQRLGVNRHRYGDQHGAEPGASRTAYAVVINGPQPIYRNCPSSRPRSTRVS